MGKECLAPCPLSSSLGKPLQYLLHCYTSTMIPVMLPAFIVLFLPAEQTHERINFTKK